MANIIESSQFADAWQRPEVQVRVLVTTRIVGSEIHGWFWAPVPQEAPERDIFLTYVRGGELVAYWADARTIILAPPQFLEQFDEDLTAGGHLVH